MIPPTLKTLHALRMSGKRPDGAVILVLSDKDAFAVSEHSRMATIKDSLPLARLDLRCLVGLEVAITGPAGKKLDALANRVCEFAEWVSKVATPWDIKSPSDYWTRDTGWQDMRRLVK